MLLLRLSGLFLLRFAERRFLALLFQEPPRSTRHQSGPSPLEYYPGKNLFAQAQSLRLFGMAYPALHTGINVIPHQPTLRITRCQTSQLPCKTMSVIIAQAPMIG